MNRNEQEISKEVEIARKEQEKSGQGSDFCGKTGPPPRDASPTRLPPRELPPTNAATSNLANLVNSWGMSFGRRRMA